MNRHIKGVKRLIAGLIGGILVFLVFYLGWKVKYELNTGGKESCLSSIDNSARKILLSDVRFKEEFNLTPEWRQISNDEASSLLERAADQLDCSNFRGLLQTPGGVKIYAREGEGMPEIHVEMESSK